MRIPQHDGVDIPKLMQDEQGQAQLGAVAQHCVTVLASVQPGRDVWTELRFLMSAITTGKCLPLP